MKYCIDYSSVFFDGDFYYPDINCVEIEAPSKEEAIDILKKTKQNIVVENIYSSEEAACHF